MQDLRSLRQETYHGTAELAMAAARLLEELVPSQEKGSVAEVPDERTVRYYLSEGLISPALEKRGTASVYGYRHLLQLLAVKRLQTEYLPIRKIKEVMVGKTEDDLEQLIGSGPGRNSALEYLSGLLPDSAVDSAPWESRIARSVQFSAPLMLASDAAARPPSHVWTRVEVEPGLELHIRDDYHAPEGREKRRLAKRLLRQIIAALTRP